MSTTVVVRYRTKPDQADINHDLVAARFQEQIGDRCLPGEGPRVEQASLVGNYRVFEKGFGSWAGGCGESDHSIGWRMIVLTFAGSTLRGSDR